MSSNPHQDTRLLRIQTGVGNNILQIKELIGKESISELFGFFVKVFSEDNFVSVADLIGQPATISIVASQAHDRHINGYINEVSLEFFEESKNRYHYHIKIVPWLWFLERHTDCRIFQEMNVIDIAEMIFKEFGFHDYKIKTTKKLRIHEYCVQYRETSLNFIQRLLEEEGIFYYFEHAESKHTLIIGDSSAAHEKMPIQDCFPARRMEAGDSRAAISGWRARAHLPSGAIALEDYDFKKASVRLDVSAAALQSMSISKDLEVFDYPGRYNERDQGETLAKNRMEVIEAGWQRFQGDCNAPTLAPGFRFTLEDHPIKYYNDSYVVVSVNHMAGNNWDGQSGAYYQNQFEALPVKTVFRPECLTRRPIIEGPQTAIVVGPAGDEIYVDKYGRVKVQFRWDRRGTGDEGASCWIRVAQGWAGPRWGAVTLPRIGMEVLVVFLDGNPDRPLITGCLYHSDALPPYSLPDHKTRSSFKTRSSPGGGNFNEIRFEDKKNKEQIFIHAAMDWDLRIKSERREYVGGSQHLYIRKNFKEYVHQDQHKTINGDFLASVGGNSGWSIEQKYDCRVGQTYAVRAGSEIMLEAGMTLTIKAGSGFIKLGPDGVTISGALVKINSGGAPGTLRAQPARPDLPDMADRAEAGGQSRTAPKRTLKRPTVVRRQTEALKRAAQNGTAFSEDC